MSLTAVCRDSLACVVRAERRRQVSAWSDGQLLDQVQRERDEGAFEELLRRHGPMVHAICRRGLGQDADDAFQATFLVLVRRIGSIRRAAPLANWLGGVAYQIVRQARRARLRQSQREWQVEALPEPSFHDPQIDDWRPLIDAAIQELPERLRGPLVLCELQGLSRSRAARQLRLPEGTLSSRLARARALLKRKLGRHGPMALALLGPLAVPAALARAACLSALSSSSVGVVPAGVHHLVEGVIAAMTFSRWKLGVSLAMLVAVVSTMMGLSWNAAGPLAPRIEAAEPNPPKPKSLPDDLERLQGAWRIVRQEMEGKDVTDKLNATEVVVIFVGRRFLQAGHGLLAEGMVELQPERNPRGIDIVDIRMSEKDQPPDKLAPKYGIYKLDGDRLTICFGPDGMKSGRPAEFATEQGMESQLVVLERIGGKDAKSAPVPASLVQTDVPVVNHKKFAVPLNIDPKRREEIKDIALWASRDGGQNWTKMGTAKANEDRFDIEVETSGTYWFKIQIAFKSGTKEPAFLDGNPDLKLRVDLSTEEDKKEQAEAYWDGARASYALAAKQEGEGNHKRAAATFETVLEQIRFCKATGQASAEADVLYWTAALGAEANWKAAGDIKKAQQWTDDMATRTPQIALSLRTWFDLSRTYRTEGKRHEQRALLLQMKELLTRLDKASPPLALEIYPTEFIRLIDRELEMAK